MTTQAEIVVQLNSMIAQVQKIGRETDSLLPKPPPQKTHKIRVGLNSRYWWLDNSLQVVWSGPGGGVGGGTYLDRNGVPQGTAPFASAVPSQVGTLSLDVLSMMPRQLEDNQGFMLKGDDTVILSGGLSAKKPRLLLTTPSGMVDCPLLCARTIDDHMVQAETMGFSGYNVYGANVHTNCLCTFDLSGVTSVSAAFLQLDVQTPSPNPIGAYYIDTIEYVDDLTNETKRANETTDADILFSFKWTNADAARAVGWTNSGLAGPWPPQWDTPGFPLWSRTDGRIDCRMQSTEVSGNQSGTAIHEHSLFTTPGITEMYSAFELMLGADTGDIDGYKLPCMVAWGNALGVNIDFGHDYASVANPDILRFHLYYYLWAAGIQSAAQWATIRGLPVCLRKEKPYVLEHHLRLSTWTNGVCNPDALYEGYLDDAPVLRLDNFISSADQATQMVEWLEVLIMHGGVPPHTHAAYYRMGPVLSSRKFIGRQFYLDHFGLTQ